MIFRSLYKIIEKKEDIRSNFRKLTNREDSRFRMKLSIDVKNQSLSSKRVSVNTFPMFKAFNTKFN